MNKNKESNAAIFPEEEDGNSSRHLTLQHNKFVHANQLESTIEKLYKKAINGLFGVLYIMSKDTSTSQNMVYFLGVAEMLQMTYFPFSPEMDFPWGSNISKVL